jgi:hypothetical protein
VTFLFQADFLFMFLALEFCLPQERSVCSRARELLVIDFSSGACCAFLSTKALDFPVRPVEQVHLIWIHFGVKNWFCCGSSYQVFGALILSSRSILQLGPWTAL